MCPGEQSDIAGGNFHLRATGRAGLLGSDFFQMVLNTPMLSGEEGVDETGATDNCTYVYSVLEYHIQSL